MSLNSAALGYLVSFQVPPPARAPSIKTVALGPNQRPLVLSPFEEELLAQADVSVTLAPNLSEYALPIFWFAHVMPFFKSSRLET